MRATVSEQVGRRQYDEEENLVTEKGISVGPHPRIGIGLPMSNIFATFVHLQGQILFYACARVLMSLFLFRYFGGSIELVSLDGWGMSIAFRNLVQIEELIILTDLFV